MLFRSHGYAQNGFGEKAVELFEYMLTTEQRPDSVTFISVLTGCSHSGLIDEAIAFFDCMESTYGITPLAEHYTCLIDGLGRAGRLVEVEALIDKMPCKDDPIVWEVLLASCAVHHNAELGECAAQHLFHLDPKNPSPYVLLSNIYASLGRHGDASAVRELMISRGVVKAPFPRPRTVRELSALGTSFFFRGVVKGRGYSWIDHKDGVQAFMVADDLQIFSRESAMFSNQESTAGVTEVHQKETCVG